MVYKKAKQKVRRVYSRGKSIFGGDLLKNPYMVGIAAGFAKNVLSRKKIIDIENIKNRISRVDGTNPLILFGAGILLKNPLLTAIGLFAIVDPPNIEKNEELPRYLNIGESEGYSNIGESEGYSNLGESEGYSNIGETEKITSKKRCVF